MAPRFSRATVLSLGAASVKIRDSDLIKLRQDVERVRKHEETRHAQRPDGEHEERAALPVSDKVVQRPSVPIAVRLRQMLETLLTPSKPSHESLEAIPEHVVTLLQVVGEEPKFERWLLAIALLPPMERNQQLGKMSFAFRVEDASSTIAQSFDRLQDSSLFHAFCQTLRDEKRSSS